MPWTEESIPRLDGKCVLITGANSGLGFESARALSDKGAHVIVAARTLDKASEAIARIRARQPRAQLEPCALDLADLSSVHAAAEEVVARHPRLDVLLNNAGVMATPHARTKDGFELQFGTNHLGHFALTGLLLELLRGTPGARVVTVSSGAHRMGKIRFDDPHWERMYGPWLAYGMSKLANLLFTYELARRAKAAGLELLAVAAHPGVAATQLARFSSLAVRIVSPVIAQPAALGALPQLYAATADDVTSGDYIGPSGLLESRGYPQKVPSSSRSRSEEEMQKLWELSERLTGVHYDLL